MAVSATTQKLIWGIFAARCAMCRRPVVWESERKIHSLTGEIAHIVGSKRDAARGKEKITAGRDEPSNLILLCREHHKIVDDNEAEFSVERLHAIKESYLTWLNSNLAEAKAWSAKIISQFIYMNVPRLDEYAAFQGFEIHHPPIPGSMHLSEFDFGLSKIMEQYRRVFDHLPIRSINASEIDYAHEGYVGQIISFERTRFRNRNVPLHRPVGQLTSFTGSPDHDPHVYHAFEGWRLQINLDLRWITTSTGYGTVRSSGAGSLLSGFARINAVDLAERVMVATGLAIGLPPSIFDQRDTPKTSDTNVDMSAFEDDVTKSRNDEWFGELTSCDGCGRIFKDGDYMIDGPLQRGGPWGNICQSCFLNGDRKLGIGLGQLYKKEGDKWPMLGGYPEVVHEEPY